MKLDPCWRCTPWATIAIAIVAATHRYDGVIAFTFFAIGIGVWLRGCTHAERFVSGLPVPGREIFLARFLPVLFLIWLPATAAIAIEFGPPGFGGAPRGWYLVEVAGAYTVMFLLAYSVRMEGVRAPDWMRKIWLVWFGLLLLMKVLPAAPVAGALLLIGSGLFVKIWRTVPGSFRLVPFDVESVSLWAIPFSNGPLSLRLMRWQFLRFVILTLGWSLILTLPVLFLYGMTGGGSFGWCTVIVVSAWTTFSERARWLWTLPIRPRALLLALMLVPAAIVGGYCVDGLPDSSPLRNQIADVVVLTGFLLFTMLFIAVFKWPRFRAWMAVPLVLVWLKLVLMKSSEAANTLLRVTTPLPEGLFLALSIAGLVLLYLAMDKIFAESEFLKNPFARR